MCPHDIDYGDNMGKITSVEHGEMKERFRTKRGSRYFECEDGTWIRMKYNGEQFENWKYVGSIDTSTNYAFEGDHYNKALFREQLERKSGPEGFTREFREGYSPIGFLWSEDGECIPHVGHSISKVFD